jgi:hypothetical protein
METAVVGIVTLMLLVAVEGLKKKNLLFSYSMFNVVLNLRPLIGLYTRYPYYPATLYFLFSFVQLMSSSDPVRILEKCFQFLRWEGVDLCQLAIGITNRHYRPGVQCIEEDPCSPVTVGSWGIVENVLWRNVKADLDFFPKRRIQNSSGANIACSRYLYTTPS